MKTEQPLWGRGMMVSPQHFQQQAAYAAWAAECIALMGLNHPWGVIEALFEPDMLKLGRLQARQLHVRFQDGTLIDTDNADALPSALPLAGESHETVVVLALPLLRANGGNCLTPDEIAEHPVRYRQRWHDVRNQFGDDTRQIAVMQPELTLRFAHQNNSDYLTCPVAHLPDYGLPDMTKILQGMPGTAHELMGTFSDVLLKYEPRLKSISVVMLNQQVPGELRYAIDAELKGVGLVRYGTEFMPEGKVMLRHLKQQNYLDTQTRM